MKSEYSGCLTVDDKYAEDDAIEMVEKVAALLRTTMEHPFVAIGISYGENNEEKIFVTHDETLGQFSLVTRKQHYHQDGEYWSVSGSQPLQWLVEDLLDEARGFLGGWSVELMDIAVARHRTNGDEFERSSSEDEFGETKFVEYNRNLAYSGVSSVPSFVNDLTTEPVYDSETARKQGQKSHEQRLA